MNKIIKTFFLIASLGLTLNACRDMLDTNSSLIAMEDEYTVKNETEAQAALNGIIRELVAITDRYVLMGELRGDLMTTTEFASSELQDINRFEARAGNHYAGKREYYTIINNCNYLLQKLDTAMVLNNEKVLLPYYEWTHTLRAWTYFQLGQVYGKISYFTQAILDLDASLAQYPELSLDELADVLINELLPYTSVNTNSASGNSAIIPLNVLLADLYLYKNEYRTAANLYYNYIYDHSITVPNNANQWTNTNMDAVSSIAHTATYNNEAIRSIAGYTSPQNIHNNLIALSYNPKPSIVPSASYVRFMSEALYIFSLTNGVAATPSGDLRGAIRRAGIQEGDAYIYVNLQGQQLCLINKYVAMPTVAMGADPGNELLPNLLIQSSIPVYRIPHLYLRFAEALNRLEKPTLAFAVLKYGLTDATVRDPLTGKVNPDELDEDFTRFPQATFFDNNRSMTARGRGNGIPVDTTFFIIPNLATKQDSIAWVEDRILEEMAAETPFEGNRFFDLLRISRRRDNHPEYMAEKVAEKYPDKEAMKARLMNINSWFLP